MLYTVSFVNVFVRDYVLIEDSRELPVHLLPP